jgi:hypothetical protein
MILPHINLILLSINVLGTAFILLGKSYLGEKGKNLATKEDISAITQKIESVKEFYSKSLESYKFQLIREYDTVKPAINLMSKVDSELIELILNTNSLILEFHLHPTEDRAVPMQRAVHAEAKYLTQYYVRYGGLECANKIIGYNNIMVDFVRGALDLPKLASATDAFIEDNTELLGIFLEPLKVSPAKTPNLSLT